MPEYTAIARLDAKNKTVILEIRDNGHVRVDAEGSLEIKLADLLGKRITARETLGCDADGNPQYSVILRSQWYSSPVGSDFS